MTRLPGETKSRFRRWLKRLLLVAFATGLGLLAADLLLRLAGFSYPLPYAPDEYCASRLSPGFRGVWSKEGVAPIEVNQAGFRDREHTTAKPPNTIRIAVLGDSFIEAFQVPIEEMFGSVLENQLNREPLEDGKRVEVLSFGVSGWGTATQLLALRHHVWRYDPDIVLLAFFAGNDVRNNSRELEPMDCRPYFRLEGQQLEADFSFREHPIYVSANKRSTRWKTRLINSSRILQLVQAFRNRPADPEAVSGRQAAAGAAGEIGLDDGCFTQPRDGAWRDAWELTERLIEQMVVEVKARDKLFALMAVTEAIQVHPDATVRQAYAERIGVENLDYPELRLLALGERAGFPVIRLTEPMREYVESTQAYLHGFANTQWGEGHWNEAGHRQAARLCAAELRRKWQAIREASNR